MPWNQRSKGPVLPMSQIHFEFILSDNWQVCGTVLLGHTSPGQRAHDSLVNHHWTVNPQARGRFCYKMSGGWALASFDSNPATILSTFVVMFAEAEEGLGYGKAIPMVIPLLIPTDLWFHHQLVSHCIPPPPLNSSLARWQEQKAESSQTAFKQIVWPEWGNSLK